MSHFSQSNPAGEGEGDVAVRRLGVEGDVIDLNVAE